MFCPQCGESNPENAVKCSRCGYELIPPLFTKSSAPKPPPLPFNGVPQTSPLAIWTLVLGILATLCLGPLATIAALIVGFMAISRISKSNGQLTGSPLAVVGIIISLAGLIIWVAVAAMLLGITSVFTAIAVPNFREAQVRSQVSRVRSDLRTLSVGLEAYKIDNNTVPPSAISPSGHPVFARSSLTTPIAYLSSMNFVDPFAPENGAPYCYFAAPGGRNWIVWSAGPDRQYDITTANASTLVTDGLEAAFSEGRANLTYDPTNGANSPGDIWRSGNGGVGQ